VPPLAVIEAE
jgi:hypothetical protein